MYDADAHFKSYDDLLNFIAAHGTTDTNIDSAVLQNQAASG
jgi:hypothetical protein